MSWGLLTNDVVEVVSPRMTLTPKGPAPRSIRLEVAGLHDGGRAEVAFSDRIALPLDQARKLLGNSDLRKDVTLAPGERAEIAARRLQSRIDEHSVQGGRDKSGVEVLTWRDQNRALLFVLRLEKMAIFLAVALIVIVASFALMASLSLILSSKQRRDWCPGRSWDEATGTAVHLRLVGGSPRGHWHVGWSFRGYRRVLGSRQLCRAEAAE